MQHCGPRSISEKCHFEFVRELCYYNCDPYIAPWIVQPANTRPKERLMLVPMCQSDCNRWWNACGDSLTCVRNWRKHFTNEFEPSINATLNKCPAKSECLPIKQIYSDSNDFCETVSIYDSSCQFKINNFLFLNRCGTKLGRLYPIPKSVSNLAFRPIKSTPTKK